MADDAKVPELELPDGRPRCVGWGKKTQCKNEAGFHTQHPSTGFCYYHDKKDGTGIEVVGVIENQMQAVGGNRKPIYSKSLKGNQKKLYETLTNYTKSDLMDMSEELAAAKAGLAQLQRENQNREGYWGDVTKLLDTISKIVERSQPKSTLTVVSVQRVLLHVVDIIAQEVTDKVALERIVQKLSGIQILSK